MKQHRPGTMRVLLAVNGTAASEAALEALRARSLPEGSIVRVLSVAELLPEPAPLTWNWSVSTLQPDPKLRGPGRKEHVLREALELSRRAAGRLEGIGLRVEAAVLSGDPGKAIVEHAAKWRADLIVVGGRAKRGLDRWLSSGVAETVVRNAACSVEVARVPVCS